MLVGQASVPAFAVAGTAPAPTRSLVLFAGPLSNGSAIRGTVFQLGFLALFLPRPRAFISRAS